MSNEVTSTRFLSVEQVASINKSEVEMSGEPYQIRDIGLLESAVAMPKQTAYGRFLHPEIHDKAAAYVFHLSQNQPFFNGNKRTGFRAAGTFLALNGKLLLPDPSHFEIIMKMARNEITKEQLAEHLSRFITPIKVPEFN